ncbi:MAG: sugar transferase [Cytophagales bacterium]|nr:MAG: sugar transferase [Cytophagales bacterium]
MYNLNSFFYTTWRIGKNEKPFKMYKIRTMRTLYNEKGQPLPDALRRTRWGDWLRKYSIDELPQIINWLKGDMNLIGPRPLPPEYLTVMSEKERQRHQIKPGITGLAQVMGRNALSWEQKMKYDLWYIKHHSWHLDCLIFRKTLYLLLFKPNGHIAAQIWKKKK